MDYVSKIQIPGGSTYNITGVIPMGSVASTSTSTVYTATISGITELKSGVCVWLTNGVVTSAANFTININGLGAKPVYRSNAATTRETTRFDKAYTIFLIYNETRVSGGCWDYVYGFDSNTTYTNMSQTEASAGTVTTGRIISAKVLSDTIEEHTAEINAVLPELVNDGAKNWLEVPDFVETVNGITFTAYRGVIYATGTATADASIAIYPKDSETGIGIANVNIVVSGCTNGTTTTYRCFFQEKTNNTYTTRVTLTTAPVEYLMTNDFSNYRYLITVYSGCTVNHKMFKPMVCTKAAWDISNVFFPYAKTNPELTICETQDRNAIIEAIDDGAKNLLKITASSKTIEGVTFTVNADGTVVANGTATANATFILARFGTYNLPVGEYILSGCTGGSATTYDLHFWQAGSTKVNYDEGTEITVTSADWNYAILIRSGQTVNALVFKPMICTKAAWDVSQEYVPYALPNPELTAAAIEVIDNGPKNLLDHTAYTRTVNGVTYTVNDDRSITITSNGTNTQSLLYLVQNYTGVPAGNYVLSGCTGGSSTTYDLRVKVGSTIYNNYDGGTDFYYNGTASFEVSIVVRASMTVSTTMKPMICTKADWDISQEYQPYRPEKISLQQAYSEGTLIATNANLNDYTTAGLYYATIAVSPTLTNTPYKTTGFRLVVEKNSLSGAAVFQTIVPTSQTNVSKIYKRVYENNAWGNWYVLSGPKATVQGVDEYIYGTGSELASNANLNDYNYACKMYSPSAAVSATISNTPWTASGFQLITVQFITTASYMQFLLPNTVTGKWYRRRYGSGTWSSWVEYDVASYLINGATAIASNTNLNNLKTPGVYTCASYSVANTLTNCPYKSSGFRCDIIQTSDTNCIRQIIQPNQMTTTGGNARYERSCVISSSTWSSWYKFEGTVVT